eukprot:scaffold285963_cov19-Tisochrysis_lutea.AAC.2
MSPTRGSKLPNVTFEVSLAVVQFAGFHAEGFPCPKKKQKFAFQQADTPHLACCWKTQLKYNLALFNAGIP